MIDEGGNVARLERVRDNDRLTQIRKWMVSEGDSFPAFNVAPLLKARNSHTREKNGSVKEEASQAIEYRIRHGPSVA